LRHSLRRFFPALLAFAVLGSAAGMQAQFYKLHNADVAVGGTGNFTTTLTSNSSNQQYTTDSAGFLGSLRDHPVSWAGVEVNYGYTHLTEQYAYNNSGSAVLQNIVSGVHEGTAAYMFHPHFFHIQPFVNVGGGALYFNGSTLGTQESQWRGVGLLETGFDLPTRNQHFGFRVQGRTLVYRAPDYGAIKLSSRSWVATTQPSVSAYVRF
jgi:hypothetical protein